MCPDEFHKDCPTAEIEGGHEPEVAAGYLAPYDSWENRRAVFGFVKDIPDPQNYDPENIELDDSTFGSLAAIERMLPMFADRPCCLVWGMRDWCFRPDCLDRFVKVWPQAEVHRLQDVGHWVVEDALEEALAIVEEFLSHRAATSVEGTLRVP